MCRHMHAQARKRCILTGTLQTMSLPSHTCTHGVCVTKAKDDTTLNVIERSFGVKFCNIFHFQLSAGTKVKQANYESRRKFCLALAYTPRYLVELRPTCAACYLADVAHCTPVSSVAVDRGMSPETPVPDNNPETFHTRPAAAANKLQHVCSIAAPNLDYASGLCLSILSINAL